MADTKDTTNFYDNLGGINQKASEYAVGRAQFLDIRNLDFDVPNALSKRPGSTFAVTAGTSGAISSLFEFVKLTGQSYVVAGTDTAMFYLAVNTFTLLDLNWNNGQPTDMLTFVNRLWMANGQNFKSWDGSTLWPAGLPAQKQMATYAPGYINNQGISQMYVGGATMNCITTLYPNAVVTRGVYVAYAYIRTDGYVGPVQFLRDARNIVVGTPFNNNQEYFNSSDTAKLYGFTIPTGYAISGVAVYIATDTASSTSNRSFVPDIGNVRVGNLGWLENTGFNFQRMSISLLPTADTSRFHFYTTIPASDLYLTALNGVTLWAATFIPGGSFFDTYSTQASTDSFSGMAIDWFATYTPKYIEQNQNVMFYAGFSSAPSTVWFTELGQPEALESDYNFEVRTNDGDRILATKAYNNQLIVFKENSFHKVVGDNPDNFQLVELSQQFGCLSNKAVIEFKEDIVWLDTRGIVRFNGASWDLISTPVEDVFRRLNISAAKEKAVAVHYKYRNQVWFGIPVDNSTVNNLTVVWDYLIDAWTFFEGFNLSSASYVKGYLNRPTVWRGDYSGAIYYHGEIFYGDNGSGITCTATPHWDKGKENETWIQRRLFLDVATVTGLTGTITGKVFKDYDATTVQATYSMYQNAFQSRAEMGVVGKAFTTQFAHFSASLPLLINGFSWAKRFLRNV